MSKGSRFLRLWAGSKTSASVVMSKVLSLVSKCLCIDAIPCWKACLAEFSLWVKYEAHFSKKNKQSASNHVIIKPNETYISLVLFLLSKTYLFKWVLGREGRKVAPSLPFLIALSSSLAKSPPAWQVELVTVRYFPVFIANQRESEVVDTAGWWLLWKRACSCNRD